MSFRDPMVYQLEFPLPLDLSSIARVTAGHEKKMTLVIALTGFLDAGQAISMSVSHLLENLESIPVATFNDDELIDYRSNRPPLHFSEESGVGSRKSLIQLSAVKDAQGKYFLLLHGLEPDFRWKGFSRSIMELVEYFGVSTLITLYSAATNVPHTRTLLVGAHGNSPELMRNHIISDHHPFEPGSVAGLLESSATHAGLRVVGFCANVPDYLVHSPYPEATFRLLQSVAHAASLDIPLAFLKRAEAWFADLMEKKIAQEPLLQRTVQEFEINFDQQMAVYRLNNPTEKIVDESGLADGDTLGEELESYLAVLWYKKKFIDSDGDDPVDPHHS